MSKEQILIEIHKQLDFIVLNLDRQNGKFKIHISSQRGDDFTRMSFIYMTISRIIKSGIDVESKIKKEYLLILVNKFYETAKAKLDYESFRYVDLYLMRFYNNLNLDYTRQIDSFEVGNYKSLFAYPVITYLFLTNYFECDKLKDNYPFSTSLKNTALSVFDYLLASCVSNKYKAFHFSEISSWKNIPEYILTGANERHKTYFKRDIQDINSYSSGIAKCLEHFSRLGDKENFELGMDFLKARKLANYKNYLNPKFLPHADHVYVETKDSQYICLDTSAHLINTYLNLLTKIYEKQ